MKCSEREAEMPSRFQAQVICLHYCDIKVPADQPGRVVLVYSRSVVSR